MLTEIAPGLLVHESECIQSNSIVVRGRDGVLLIDPGLTNDELATIAADIGALDQRVVAGFSTHPHWDHVLWHAAFGDVPRYATARGVSALQEFLTQPDWEADIEEGLPPEVAGRVPMALFGLLTGLPTDTVEFPWDGPTIRVIEHQAHASGHAALLIEEHGVLVAGDMLSDVLIPMLGDTDDPIGDYLAGLDLLEAVARHAEVVVPGHGSVGNDVGDRITRDRAYVEGLRDGRIADDPRIGPDAQPGWEWVRFVHEGQAERFG